MPNSCLAAGHIHCKLIKHQLMINIRSLRHWNIVSEIVRSEAYCWAVRSLNTVLKTILKVTFLYQVLPGEFPNSWSIISLHECKSIHELLWQTIFHPQRKKPTLLFFCKKKVKLHKHTMDGKELIQGIQTLPNFRQRNL